jgi:hypothetical protein
MNGSWSLDQNGLVAWFDVQDIEIWDSKSTSVSADTALEEDVFATISWATAGQAHVEDITVEEIRGNDIVFNISSVAGDLERWRVE